MDRKKKDIIELTLISAEDYRKAAKMPLKVVADNVRSMHNIGSIMRTADAFCVEETVLCGISGLPPHPEITKTALGAEKSVKWRYEESAIKAVLELKEQGYKICVLEQTHGSIALGNFRPGFGDDDGKKYALVVGNEVDGVSQTIVDCADIVLEIPQGGTKHSLNVSVSAGIAMWTFFNDFVNSGKIATFAKAT